MRDKPASSGRAGSASRKKENKDKLSSGRLPEKAEKAEKEKKKRRKHREKPPQAVAASSSAAHVKATGAAPSPAAVRPGGMRVVNVVSFEDLGRIPVDTRALAGEVVETSQRLNGYDEMLRAQHQELVAARALLVSALAEQGELREAKLRAEQQVVELRLLLEYGEAARTEAARTARDFHAAMALQDDELKAAEAKLWEHREAEAKAFVERRRLWERTLEEWLRVGSSKRIDLVGGGGAGGAAAAGPAEQQSDVFNTLHQLLATEESEREAQQAYLQHAGEAERDADRALALGRAGWLDGQITALSEEHEGYAEQLASTLSRFLKDELERSNAQLVATEREAQLIEQRVQTLAYGHDERAEARRLALNTAVPPLLSQATALEAELSRRLASLPADHPSTQLALQGELTETALEEARLDKAEADRLYALLKSEKQAHTDTKAELDARGDDLRGLDDDFEVCALASDTVTCALLHRLTVMCVCLCLCVRAWRWYR